MAFWMLFSQAVAIFVASLGFGWLPFLVMSRLSQHQLRWISAAGMGLLVGTSLIVVIPEGMETLYFHDVTKHTYATRFPIQRQEGMVDGATTGHSDPKNNFWAGTALIVGFGLMYLIDRIPKHVAAARAPAPDRTVDLQIFNREGIRVVDSLESGSITPTTNQPRSFATTIGLALHATADGIALGASATIKDTKAGHMILFALMIHKLPAAFGLTTALLKEGFPRRSAKKQLAIFSAASPLSALFMYTIISSFGEGDMSSVGGQWVTGMVLLFSGGTFLYVAMHAMQDESSHHHNEQADPYGNEYIELPTMANSPTRRGQEKAMPGDTFVAVLGMLVPLLMQWFFDEH